ncbi:DUF6457 domain-containing protein [Arthrobacter globiformis]|uniref:Molybdopterin-guanine dinucleotide biosynthesis protein n=1 Tax=Arthrobacter globiformis TaxID=1665 RepID=A0A328HIL6_ARTGO|nr:DUF6457 domain-containing protein [Arthrobacter globiformis]RAM36843.1 molybdopterin-guanine dinucleotide biosynthesis protein [Arthrobacter globiformis]
MAVDDEMQILGEWCKQLARALQIPDLDVDQELLLDLARKSADSVIHAAAPVTAFMVGYVAGQEAGRESAGSEGSRAATARAADIAFRLCEQRAGSQSVSGPEQNKQP